VETERYQDTPNMKCKEKTAERDEELREAGKGGGVANRGQKTGERKRNCHAMNYFPRTSPKRESKATRQ
jgi:hypothetical protein